MVWLGTQSESGPNDTAWAAETDPAKRDQIVMALKKRILEDIPLVPLGQYRSLIAYRNNLKGIIPGPALFSWNVEKT